MITDSRFMPEVLQVAARPDFHLQIFFNDGSVGEIDARPLLVGPAFEPLKNEQSFRDRLTVMHRTVAWDLDGARDHSRCIDLDPVQLYRLVHAGRPQQLGPDTQR